MPTQLTGKIFCGDPSTTSSETLEAGVTVVNVLDMDLPRTHSPDDRLRTSWLTPRAAAHGG